MLNTVSAPIALLGRAVSGLTLNASTNKIYVSADESSALAGDACAWLNLTVAALIQGRRVPESVSEVARAAAAAIAEDEALLAAAAHEQRGFVMTTLRIAFAAAFRHDAFEPAVVFAVNLGGDADTNGAVTGALAGACSGVAGAGDRSGGDEAGARLRHRIVGVAAGGRAE